MVAGCGNNVLKYILLFLNFVIFILSLAGVIGSLVFILKPGTLEDASKQISQLKDISGLLSATSIRMGLYVLLAASVLILIISFLGCCGAWKEIRCLLGLYATILLIILAVEVAAFVVVLVKKDKVESELKTGLTKAKATNATAYADLEKVLECCGVNDGDPCASKGTTPTPEHKIGCYNRIVDLVKQYYTIVLAVSVITVIIEVFLISFSCCLCSGLGENVA